MNTQISSADSSIYSLLQVAAQEEAAAEAAQAEAASSEGDSDGTGADDSDYAEDSYTEDSYTDDSSYSESGIARLLLTVHRAALLIHPAPQVQELILVPLP